MDKQSYEQLSKFGKQPADIELFFSGRKSLDEKEDNTPWLITLADLLTILLVFSFVIIGITGKSNLNSLSVQAQKNTIGSLVSVAEATVNSSPLLLSIPLTICQNGHNKTKQRDDSEKIIMRSSFPIADDGSALGDVQKSQLNQIAQVSIKNPSSRIIIAMTIDTSSQQSARHAKDIITYLTTACNIDKANVFLQPLSDVLTANPLSGANPEKTGQHIEVKLLKDFWSL